MFLSSPQPPGKDPSQTSQTSLQGDSAPDTLTKTPVGAEAKPPVRPSRTRDGQPIDRQLPDEGISIVDSDKPESEASGKVFSSSDSGIEDGKSTSDEGKPVDTPLTENPALLAQPEMVPKIPQSQLVVKGGSASMASGVVPVIGEKGPPTPTPDPTPLIGLNGSTKRGPSKRERVPIGANMDNPMAHHNANGMISKRYSDAGSVSASESMDISLNLSGDMSVNKDDGSLCPRVVSNTMFNVTFPMIYPSVLPKNLRLLYFHGLAPVTFWAMVSADLLWLGAKARPLGYFGQHFT